ncbi:hypothetical protein ScPMuIL_001583 [Solemya velum]
MVSNRRAAKSAASMGQEQIAFNVKREKYYVVVKSVTTETINILLIVCISNTRFFEQEVGSMTCHLISLLPCP